jgi:hypothetical protein
MVMSSANINAAKDGKVLKIKITVIFYMHSHFQDVMINVHESITPVATAPLSDMFNIIFAPYRQCL